MIFGVRFGFFLFFLSSGSSDGLLFQRRFFRDLIQKYCDADEPQLKISVREAAGRRVVDFVDNGSGIPKDAQRVIFEKFARASDSHAAGGAGLGLAICREVMARLGGAIVYLPGQGGAAFRVILPERSALAAQ